MGTLFEQPQRKTLYTNDSDILALIEDVKTISKKTGWSVDQVLRAYEIKETERRTTFMVQNGDIHDEQMSGLGKLIQEMTSALQRVGDNLGD
jgi:hypothetical protein